MSFADDMERTAVLAKVTVTIILLLGRLGRDTTRSVFVDTDDRIYYISQSKPCHSRVINGRVIRIDQITFPVRDGTKMNLLR
jgi:hypothetical protein